jgi:pantoate--beta-alanine ligase
LRIIRYIDELRKELNAARAKGKSVGMMGTSGALHDGHLSLVRAAVAENDLPVMFYGGGGSNENMPISYKRDPDRDLALCEAAGMQIAYVPSGDFMPRAPATVVSLPTLFGGDTPGMEDPKHLFQITFAMAKLYNIFGECRMYSGEKDWQQLAIFTRLAEDLSFPVKVVHCPTIREPDGLAMSSRNVKLTPEQRAKAPLLYKALQEAVTVIEAGERSLERVKTMVAERIRPAGELDYLVSVDPAELTPKDPMTGDVRLLVSMKVGEIRLVDNIGARAPA